MWLRKPLAKLKQLWGLTTLVEDQSPTNRLDVKLATNFPEHSRATWQKYIKAGFISVNGAVITAPKYMTSGGDKLQINLPPASDFSDQTLPVIYMDDNVVVINKPAGILTHSKGAMNDEFTVADFLSRFSVDIPINNRTGIVHRLDRGTSGVIIGARNLATQKILQKQFADRKTKKTYLAIVEGHPKNDTAVIDLPIARNPARPSSFKVDASGKQAETSYQVLTANDKLSILRLYPRTGRTHQLRVHLQYIGTPILGDKLYGGGNADRVYLHASSLEITIPGLTGGQRKVFRAPTPDEFVALFPEAKKCT